MKSVQSTCSLSSWVTLERSWDRKWNHLGNAVKCLKTVREGSSPKISQHNRKVLKKTGLSRGEGLELAHQGRSHCENCGILRWEQMAPTGTWAGESALGSPSWQKLPLWQTVRKEEIPYRCAGASYRNVTTPCGYLGVGVYKRGTSRRTLTPLGRAEEEGQWDAVGIHVVMIFYLVSLSPSSPLFLSLYLTFAVK